MSTIFDVEKPFLGHQLNFRYMSPQINCWADAIGAMVFSIGEDAVLAHSAEEAVDVICKEAGSKDLARIQSEIRQIENRIGWLEEELDELEAKEATLRAAIQARRNIVLAKNQEWLANQLTLAI